MRWVSNPPDPSKSRLLALALRDSASRFMPGLASKLPPSALPVLADLLVQRGIEDAELAARFLAPSLDHLHDPLQMAGMKTALDRIEAAIERKEKVLIYGDYDVDGTTAIVILKTAIELCGGAASFHVPHRIHEGYDLSEDVIERAAAEGVHLIISVDNGIRAFAAAETARRSGHRPHRHRSPPAAPDGVPGASPSSIPTSRMRLSVQVICAARAWLSSWRRALMQRQARTAKNQTQLVCSFMKVVAIATIADAVPLLG